jgi:hypothetical protein
LPPEKLLNVSSMTRPSSRSRGGVGDGPDGDGLSDGRGVRSDGETDGSAGVALLKCVLTVFAKCSFKGCRLGER